MIDRFTKVVGTIAAAVWTVHGVIEGMKAWSSGRVRNWMEKAKKALRCNCQEK